MFTKHKHPSPCPESCDECEGRAEFERDNAEALEIIRAFQSYLEDDSRSERRRQACLTACRAYLAGENQ